MRTPRFFVALATAIALLSASGPGAGAQSAPDDGAVVLVLDASGSMLEPDGQGGTKIDTAKAALRALIDEMPEGLQVGLRVYGHRVPSAQKAQACQDTEAIVPVGALDRDRLRSAVDRFDALGETPIGLSLLEAAEDLPGDTPGAIVLVSDGRDECHPELGPEPCQVARDLAARGVELRIEAVGLQVDDAARSQLECIADATGGSYVDVTDAGRLAEELVAAQVRARRTFSTRGTPVQGGPSMIDATPLDDGGAGTWQDTILPGEELWYGLEVAPGSTVRAQVTFDGSQNDSRYGVIEAFFFDDAGDQQARGYDVNTADDVVTFAVEHTVDPAEDVRPADVELFFKLEADRYTAGEYPVVWTLEVEPPEEEEPTTTTTAPPATEAPTGDAELAVDDPGDDDPPLTVPGVGLGLVLGAVLGSGATVLVRRRTSSAQP